MSKYIVKVLNNLNEKFQHEKEFLQCTNEALNSLKPIVDKNPKYEKYSILERITIPDKIVTFQVPWLDDNGKVQVNIGYRVQFNNALGPYKGGLRLHPTVNLSIIKFLGFEQIIKNSLTGLAIGGGKGGSDFDPKGKTDLEIMKFCQNFMRELQKHIGSDIDVPAGDIGVGSREIGYLYGQYKKITNKHVGVLTGKNINWGGSFVRPEATGYGSVYFMNEMLKTKNIDIEKKLAMISGSGNVAQYTAEKVIQLGGKVITMSDSNGTIIDKDGINEEKLSFIKEIKNKIRMPIFKYTDKFKSADYVPNEKPWKLIKADLIFPSATQNEINENDAIALVKNGCIAVSEGANMPSTPEAIKIFLDNDILFGPGKAANSGGVAVSGLEMSQNAQKLQWDFEEVDKKLYTIIKNIHDKIISTSFEYGTTNYVNGANIVGFKKVADTMIDMGI